MKQHYVIVFNGPPGSGKDLACDWIEETIDDSHHQRFKHHLFDCTTVLFNICFGRFMELYNDRVLKETPTCELRGMSPREAMIFTSETVIKPNFGKDYFGVTTAENLRPGLTVFSDGGFVEELEPVYDECDGNMIIVQIHRPGYDFLNDSRDYINDFKDVPVIKINNESDLETYKHKVFEVVENFLSGEYESVQIAKRYCK